MQVDLLGDHRCMSAALYLLVSVLVRRRTYDQVVVGSTLGRIAIMCMSIGDVTSHPGQLSLAIPLWAGKMSTGDDYGHRQGRSGAFCVTVGPVTRTADMLTQSVIWRT